MERLPSESQEQIAFKRDSLPLMELYLQTNRGHLKELQRKFESLGMSAGAVARVLGLPVEIFNDGEEEGT